MKERPSSEAAVQSGNELARQQGGAELAAAVERAREYAAGARASNTRRAYAADWADFSAWCDRNGLDAMPAAPAAVALYIAELADRARPSTIQRRLASISHRHKASGLESPSSHPSVREVWKGIRRVRGVAANTKAPILADELRAMLASLPATRRGARDRALLLVSWLGAFRRSEVAGLERSDVEFTRDGLLVTLRRSKTDQEGRGGLKALPYGASADFCAVRALATWLEEAGISEGPLFRAVSRTGRVFERALTGHSVALVVKRTAAAAGLDPTRVSGHSLRAGFATSAALAGKPQFAIKAMTGHKSDAMLARYTRVASLWRDNAASGLL